MRNPWVAAPTLAILLAATLAASAPTSAHTTVEAGDGMLCLTVGHLDEPVATYHISGLDLIVREKLDPAGDCGSANRGDEVGDFHNMVTEAVLVAPGGEERDQMPLGVQRGETGRYTGAAPYILTEAGQYSLRLAGAWEGHDVSGTYAVSGAFDDSQDFMFPRLDEGASLADLQARLDAMETQLRALQDEVDALESPHTDAPEGQDSPASAFLLLAGSLLAAAIIVRRRQA